jgi:hypothetical protein
MTPRSIIGFRDFASISRKLGGVLSQYASWNWIFLVNAPVGVFAVVLSGRPGTPGAAPTRRPARPRPVPTISCCFPIQLSARCPSGCATPDNVRIVEQF